MKEKQFGKVNLNRTIIGLTIYFIASLFLIAAAKFIYVLLMLHYKESTSIFDLVLCAGVVKLMSLVANNIIYILKLENAKFFSKLTLIFAPIFIYLYIFSSYVIVNFVVLQVEPSELSNFIIEALKNGIFVFDFAKLEPETPFIVVYLFELAMIISLAVPKGKFNLTKGIYMDGIKVNFKSYDVITNSLIDFENLKCNDRLYTSDRKTLMIYSRDVNHCYTLYVSQNSSKPAFVLVLNAIIRKGAVRSINFTKYDNYYYDSVLCVNEFIPKLEYITYEKKKKKKHA